MHRNNFTTSNYTTNCRYKTFGILVPQRSYNSIVIFSQVTLTEKVLILPQVMMRCSCATVSSIKVIISSRRDTEKSPFYIYICMYTGNTLKCEGQNDEAPNCVFAIKNNFNKLLNKLWSMGLEKKIFTIVCLFILFDSLSADLIKL